MRSVHLVTASIGYAICLLALPVVLVLDGPVGGWVLALGLWSLNWGAQVLTGRVARVAESPALAVGVTGISSIARAFVVFILLMAVGLKVSEEVALTGGAVFAVAFTFDLMGRTLTYSVRQKLPGGGAPR
jgi:hypothetical protein